ncbi:regulator of g protein signaling [Anaeramoeba flamelloides]|uniref:Regulator of g protein signaling n=1 Tax=Anaeramoeba flamelloides TaxID=1746091 RepID=A0AAV7YIF4_9EUKA|nr:regulator of g protein signaling [Anaeramoeba flamelloides]
MDYSLFIPCLILICSNIFLGFFFLKRHHKQPVKIRSKSLTIAFLIAGSMYTIAWWLFLEYEKEINNFFFYYCFQIIPNMYILLFLGRTLRLRFIYTGNKNKLIEAKRLYLSSEKINKETSSSRCGERSDTGGVETKKKEGLGKLETKFFLKQSRISEKRLFFILISFFIGYSILSVIIFYGTNIKTMDDFYEMDASTYNIPFNIVIGFNIISWIFSMFLIRKIKDNYFIRDEIVFIFIVSIIYFVINLRSVLTKNIKSMIISTIVHQFSIAHITVAIPIYISYVRERKINRIIKDREKTRKKITKKNSKGEINFENSFDEGDTSGDSLSGEFRNFNDIISLSKLISYWMIFAQLNYSIENIMFVRLVRTFQNQKLKRKRKKISNRIYNEFIKPGSICQINLSSKCSKQLISNYESDPSDIELFEDAKNEIIYLMFSNSYPIFLESRIYKEMLIQEKIRDPLKSVSNQKEIDDKTDLDLVVIESESEKET